MILEITTTTRMMIFNHSSFWCIHLVARGFGAFLWSAHRGYHDFQLAGED